MTRAHTSDQSSAKKKYCIITQFNKKVIDPDSEYTLSANKNIEIRKLIFIFLILTRLKNYSATKTKTMSSYFKSNMISLFVLLIALLMTACNTGKNENNADKKDTTAMSQSNLPTAGLTGGALDTLYVDSASFAKLPNKKIVFAVTFRSNDTLTFHGWAADKDSIFGTDPDIKLKKYKASTINYTTDMYFGNVVLKANAVNKIQAQLKSQNAHTVIFAPKLVDGTHIGYDIYVG